MRMDGDVNMDDIISNWPRRDDLYNYLDPLISKSEQSQGEVALLLMDLDNFREICELFWFQHIDEYLAYIGNVIKEACPANSFIAWLGSDEFAVVLPDTDKAQAVYVAESICNGLAESTTYRSYRTHISASIGLSCYPDDAQERNELMKNSTLAMNWVKKHGKKSWAKYEVSMSEQISRRRQLVNDFNEAINKDQFFLHYQPQVSITKGKQTIVGAEALIRWQHPVLGKIAPLDFIPIAEETGFINQVGEWVLQTACSDFSSWLQGGLILERLAVNVSIIQLLQADFADRVLNILELSQLEPAYLELEITESQILNLSKVKPQIEKLRNTGVKFAIDDFGTGFSSLNHLRFMGFDTIKIDKGYVHNILTNPRDRVIVGSILNMANQLQLGIIAEGVETDAQLDYIRQLEIGEIQGYYYSPPVGKHEFETLFKRDSYTY